MSYSLKVPAKRIEPFAWLGKTDWIIPSESGYKRSNSNLRAILNKSHSMGRKFAEEVRNIVYLAAFDFTPSGPRPAARTFYSDIYFMSSKVLATGQKTIQLTQGWCEAFENTELSLRFQDYRQPFPTMVIEFPANYAEGKFVPGEGEYPEFVAVHHEVNERTLLFEVGFRSGQMTALIPYRLEDEIESIFQKMLVVPLDELNFNEAGTETSLVPFLRIAMNAMIAMIYGTDWIKLDPTQRDQSNQRRLKALKRGKDHAVSTRARIRLDMLPEYYQFSQSIKAFEEKQASPQELSTQDVSHRKTHWRRGHWRHQAMGPGRTQRDLRWIRPMLISAGLFKGDLKDTSTTYTT